MPRFRLATFNANSIRMRLEITLNWLREHEPDVLCIQETRVVDSDFPVDAFAEVGYKCSFVGQKSFNGVAIVSRAEPDDVAVGIGAEGLDDEARLIRVRMGGMSIVNGYFPQGTATDSPRFAYKLDWIASLKDYFAREFTPQDMVVLAGDFNVAPEPIDVYDPDAMLGCVGFHPREHAALDYVREWGFTDVFRVHHAGEPRLYSFFDYRVPHALRRKIGWRLDHIWATEPLASKSMDCWIDTAPRLLEKPSDHTFVVADFDLT